jgi:hypothetical protein
LKQRRQKLNAGIAKKSKKRKGMQIGDADAGWFERYAFKPLHPSSFSRLHLSLLCAPSFFPLRALRFKRPTRVRRDAWY